MKKNLKFQELEDLLAAGEPPEPPAGLAERIKAEIPAEIRLVSETQGEVVAFPRRSFFSRARPWLMAASVVASLGAGWLVYLNQREIRPLEARVDKLSDVEPEPFSAATAAAPTVAPPPPPPPPAAARPAPKMDREEAAKLEALGYAVGVEGGVEGGIAGGVVGGTVGGIPSVPEVAKAKRQRKDEAWSVDGVVVTDTAAIGSSPSYYNFDSFEEMQQPAEIPATTATPLSDERSVSAGTATTQAELEKIPTARDPWAILQEAPGVKKDRIQVGGNESGQQSTYLQSPAPSTGGTTEPNDLPYGDVFFKEYGENPFIDTEEDQLSTFGLDVDTGSYTVMRRYLTDGNLPPREAVRVEEYVNFFDYGDRAPEKGDFALVAEGAATPFATHERYRVVRFGVKAREVSDANRKPALLIFTVDVSGSMDQENRLGLVKKSLYLLLDELKPEDRVGLVVYGSQGRVLLEPTSDLAAIRRAIEWLVAEGSTNAEEGLRLAYGLADKHFRPGAINRVILCSDGVANVGATGPESIGKRIEMAAEKGIELTTVGFGMGNYNDVLMEQLADQGDGSYAYVDDLTEARRIFVENLTGTLQTIASDAKVQVVFNPKVVARWRLVGYENRDIADEDFRNDTIDAGEIGAGHAVSAVYELKLQPEAPASAVAAAIYLRYKSKATGEVVEQNHPLRAGELEREWTGATPSLRLASVVAQFAGSLKGSYWTREDDFADLFCRAQRVSAEFPGRADVAELASLIGRAAGLWKGR